LALYLSGLVCLVGKRSTPVPEHLRRV